MINQIIAMMIYDDDPIKLNEHHDWAEGAELKRLCILKVLQWIKCVGVFVHACSFNDKLDYCLCKCFSEGIKHCARLNVRVVRDRLKNFYRNNSDYRLVYWTKMQCDYACSTFLRHVFSTALLFVNNCMMVICCSLAMDKWIWLDTQCLYTWALGNVVLRDLKT